MAIIIPPEHVNVIYSISIAGKTERISTAMGGFIDGGLGEGPDGPVDIANRSFDCFLNIFAGFSDEMTLEEAVCYTGDDPMQVGYSTRDPEVGTSTNDANAPSVSVLVRKNTGLAGRRYRGRMFLPAPGDNFVTAAGALSSGLIDDFNAGLALYLEALADDGVLGWSMPARLLHSDATAPTPITSLTVDPIAGKQGRRSR